MKKVCKILHVITCLDDGGAESMLYKFIQYTHIDTHYVVSLRGDGKYGNKIKKLGVRVVCLNMSPNFPSVIGLIKIILEIIRVRPNIIKSWMYHANLIGGFAGRLLGIPVVWGIHNTTLDIKNTRLRTRMVNKVCAILSAILPEKIISVSEGGVKLHSEIGYDSKKMLFIPNGYDTSAYFPNTESRQKLRSLLGVGEYEILIGLVARFNPQKDHINLLSAFTIIKKRYKNVKLLLVGPQVDNSNCVITGVIRKNGLQDSVMLLGAREDVPSIMNAIDLFVLSSAYGEACVATNVGDSREIICKTGWIVEPRNPTLLAGAIDNALIELGDVNKWAKRQSDCRQRVQDNYSIEKYVERYRAVFMEVIK
jgi:glycosyltransferase involved in cell wall biosynthesis